MHNFLELYIYIYILFLIFDVFEIFIFLNFFLDFSLQILNHIFKILENYFLNSSEDVPNPKKQD